MHAELPFGGRLRERGATLPSLLCRSLGDGKQGIVVIDEILEELLQSAFPSIVRHQPNTDACPEFRHVVDKAFGWNLVRQVEFKPSEPIAHRPPSISWFPIGIQEEPHRSASAEADGRLDAVEYGVPAVHTSYLGNIRREFLCRVCIPFQWTLDAMPKQEVLDDVHIVSAFDVQSGSFDSRHQRTSISCSTATPDLVASQTHCLRERAVDLLDRDLVVEIGPGLKQRPESSNTVIAVCGRENLDV